MEFEYATGCLKPKIDVRNYKAVATVTMDDLPAEYDGGHVPIKNQQKVGSCVAHAICEMMEWYNQHQEGKYVQMSTAYIYGNRRNSDHKEEGMYMLDALDNARKYGVPPYSEFGGNTEVPTAIELFELKGLETTPAAYPNRISSYFRLERPVDIKQSIIKNGPVVISIEWFDNYYVDADGLLCQTPNWPATSKGYHAMMVYGWTRLGWLTQNSWGTNWGNEGTCIIPYSTKLWDCFGTTDTIINGDPTIKDKKIAELKANVEELQDLYAAKVKELEDLFQKQDELEVKLNMIQGEYGALAAYSAKATADYEQQLEAYNNRYAELTIKYNTVSEQLHLAHEQLYAAEDEIMEKQGIIESLTNEMEVIKPYVHTAKWIVKILNFFANLFQKKS